MPTGLVTGASDKTSRVRRPVVGRHSDAVDVTGPIDMTGFDGKRRNFMPFAIATAVLLAATVIAVLLRLVI
jgi:hypothetical protein